MLEKFSIDGEDDSETVIVIECVADGVAGRIETVHALEECQDMRAAIRRLNADPRLSPAEIALFQWCQDSGVELELSADIVCAHAFGIYVDDLDLMDINTDDVSSIAKPVRLPAAAHFSHRDGAARCACIEADDNCYLISLLREIEYFEPGDGEPWIIPAGYLIRCKHARVIF